MARETHEQIKELAQKSQKILITTKKRYTGDGLASSLALAMALKKLNKNSEIIIDAFTETKPYSFLPNIKEIKPEAVKLKKFQINLDISQTGIDELSYDIEGDNLRIFLTPKRGVFTQEDLKFETSLFAYDLIFTLNSPDLESLGKIYDDHRDFFYQIPVVNIDHTAGNEQYGHLNLNEITATSTSEIIFKMISKWPDQIMDEKIATCLLTGMIDATNSFKTSNVSPESLQIVGQLINWGAKRQEIIEHLYQTKTISTLKLWGRVLSRLQGDGENKLVWSKLNANDFVLSGANEGEIPGVINELICNSSAINIFVLFYQLNENQTKVIVRSLAGHNAFALTKTFNPQGDKDEANFTLSRNLEESEKEVIQILESQLR